MHNLRQILRNSLPALICVQLAAAWQPAAAAESPPPRVGEGKKLVESTACESCHAKKAGGDGTSMYTRRDRKVLNKARLVAQVARCSSELNLGLFPDDEAAIAEYLNFTFYKFKD
jgi:cytochrome c553